MCTLMLTDHIALAEVIAMPRIDGTRYQAAKSVVRHRCEHLQLCAEATQRCVDKAAQMVRSGSTAASAASAGIALAKRLHRAGGRAYVTGPGAA
jgi:nicotinic acid mononucleotide adenylyltransferase